jgi:hypothetical protein
MLTLPTKPKIKIEDAGPGRYLITFLSPIENEEEFQQMIRLYLEKGLDEGDALTDPQWDSKSVSVITTDIRAFEKKLNFVRIISSV